MKNGQELRLFSPNRVLAITVCHSFQLSENGKVAALPLYAAAIFLSAFLLFQVQPLIAKAILPWFGGAAGVWTTCLVFFQITLLVGYFYSHWLTNRLKPKAQANLHLVLLLVSLISLPIMPKEALKPSGAEEPIGRILLVLLATVGLPYLLLSTTSSLVQAWYGLRQTALGKEAAYPYRLYALSNFGSMLGLLSYPFLLEPALSLRLQALSWSGGYILYALCCGAIAWQVRGLSAEAPPVAPDFDPEMHVYPEPAAVKPTLRLNLYWVFLSALGSTLLLSISNHLSVNIAAIPFLWVIPLSLYLLSFILCFGSKEWVWRSAFTPFPLAMLTLMSLGVLMERKNIDIKLLIPIFCTGLFISCVLCHGELARTKPHPRYLTSFYLMVSVGGALGGLLTGVVAPLIFRDYYELPLALMATAVLALFTLYREPPEKLEGVPFYLEPYWAVLAGVVAFGGIAFAANGVQTLRSHRRIERNFYGVLLVRDTPASEGEYRRRQLVHGTIMHGEQFFDPKRKNRHASYYGEESGAGRTLRYVQEGKANRVAVVGLGTGSLASYGRKGDVYHIYEINPLVPKLATTEFSYTKDSPAEVSILLGDARLTLERKPPQGYDAIMVDAFSSDSIPVHLLTKEAMALYFRHLKPKGILAVHISNRYLNLAPIVQMGAKAVGKEARFILDNPATNDMMLSPTTWVIVANDKTTFAHPLFASTAKAIEVPKGLRVWTDDYSALYQIME